MVDRRGLLLAGAAAASRRAWGQGRDKTKLARIGVMSLCFESILKGPAYPNDPKRTVEMLDFADMVAERFGIHILEFQSTDFASAESAYFKEFRSRIKKAGSEIGQLNLDFANLNASATDPVIRIEAVDLTKIWIDHSVILGSPRVMVSQGTLAAAVRQAAIDALRTMNTYATAHGVALTMEPRWRADAVNVPWGVFIEVVKAAGIRVNPDCGNFPDAESRAAALPVMYGMTAGSSHIKHLPDRFDTVEAIRISKQAGYNGTYTIESRVSNGADPYEAVQTVVDILLANI